MGVHPGMSKSNGAVLYEGNSLLNGDPIAAIATGLYDPSSNSGTGRMVQIWILHAKQHPMDAIRLGLDAAICGDCDFRAKGENGTQRSCYVTMMAPGNIWKGYQAGRYAFINNGNTAKRLLKGTRRNVRVGAYGDPAAIPYGYWHVLLSGLKHTGYTSQWRTCDQRLQRLFMASVRSATEYAEATAKGWRTYRTRLADDPLLPREFICPKTDEGGNAAECDTCLLCDGTRRKAGNPVTILHGTRGMLKAGKEVLIQIRNRRPLIVGEGAAA